MEILVCLKQIPVNESTSDNVEGRDQFELCNNRNDLFALEAALKLKEACGGRLTCISMGPAQCAGPLKEALSLGADRAILLSSPVFAGADTLATSFTLAASIRKLSPYDLIFTGEQSSDGETGQVGPEVAEYLGIPHLTRVIDVRYEEGSPEISAIKECGDCELEYVLPLPALFSVRKHSNRPRLPTIRGTLRARRETITIWTEEHLAADPGRMGLKGSPTRVLEMTRLVKAGKRQKGEVNLFEEDTACVSRLVSRLGLTRAKGQEGGG
ncbi:electron transfer flavoprotein subunit beta/FixA family protein [Paenibacillus durus]|uniref:Electron transfer flavoprotein small subunit n=1 Tax=Paenibacillus durus TaxID=44251 RepID=A0A089HMQ6_PAEDU|nr:electron transfer flavoprotein subunit beta/FixA family protein [Paenibacillus durus]AIQ13261.1 hypothetical protein PDUR_16110 [Paenibacillus durus]